MIPFAAFEFVHQSLRLHGIDPALTYNRSTISRWRSAGGVSLSVFLPPFYQLLLSCPVPIGDQFRYLESLGASPDLLLLLARSLPAHYPDLSSEPWNK